MSEFRWAAVIAVWTLLAGPIFSGPGTLRTPQHNRRAFPLQARDGSFFVKASPGHGATQVTAAR
jgi:hypothetical protein